MKTQAAETAQAIRKELKAAFPNMKFKVTQKTYSMGNSVSISWVDGASEKAVDAIVCKYQQGSFNSMEDIYEYTNNITGLPQVKYVQTHREISTETYKHIYETQVQGKIFSDEVELFKLSFEDFMNTHYHNFFARTHHTYGCDPRNMLWRLANGSLNFV